MESSNIKLNNTINTRSLSSLVNKNGQHIKKNYLIRSDALNHIDQEDVKQLKEIYHIKRIIDFRCDNEIISEPDLMISTIEYIHCPVLPNERVGITRKGKDEDSFKEFVKVLHENGIQKSIDFMSKIYEEFLTPFATEGYKRFLHILLEDVQGATLWHCSAGKDRAGFATILILYCLDFDMDVIFKDYMDTNIYYQKKIANLTSLYGEKYKEILETLFGVQENYFQILFSKIKEQFGSMDNYLENNLSITSLEKEKLRQIYLGD